MTKVDFLGIYVENYGPIKQQYLEVVQGLNILYGLNAAGKTQILDCLVKAISNDSIFSIVNETFDFQESTMAGLLFKANSDSVPFDGRSRLWSRGPGDHTLPNSEDVLEALLGLDNVAKLSESPQSLIEVDTNYSNESEDLIRETVSSGLLVLIPFPARDGYPIDRFQIIYSIKRSSESKIFQKHFRELREAMTHAYLECEPYRAETSISLMQALLTGDWDQADISLSRNQNEIWSKHLKNIERSPLYNVFTLQGSLADRTFDHYGYGWGTSLDKEGLLQWPMPFVPIASLGFVYHVPIDPIWESKKRETIEQLSLYQTHRMREEVEGYLNDIEIEREHGLSRAQDGNNLKLLDDSEKEDLRKEFLKNYSEKLSIEVNELAQTFLLGLPAATFELKDPEQWMLSNPPSWQFSNNNGLPQLNVYPQWGDQAEVEFESLPKVQRRFLQLAMSIKLSNDFPYDYDGNNFSNDDQKLLIVDGPESGLNRESEDHMARGFSSLQSQNITCIVASHSPSFSNLGNVKVNLVEMLSSGSKITSLKMPEV